MTYLLNCDEDLIKQIHSEEDEAYQLLLNRYLVRLQVIVRTVAKRLGVYHYCLDDYLLPFFLGFRTSIHNYAPNKGKFRTYFGRILERRICAEMIKQLNSKNPLDHCLSLDEEVDDGIKRMDMIEDKTANDCASTLNVQEARLVLRSQSQGQKKDRSTIRSQIILLRNFGLSYKQIAQKLQLSSSQVRRILKEDDEDLRKVIIHLK